MIGVLRSLAGDALLAAGELVRGASVESSNPVLIPDSEIFAALDELSDSALLNIAATVVEGRASLTFPRVSAALVDALRDRAAQFAAVEADDASAGISHLTDSPRRGQ